jgi:ATP-binding cassette subfamily B protein
MEKGRIIEEGKHSQLIKLNGSYANAFRLQAEGYQNSEESVAE